MEIASLIPFVHKAYPDGYRLYQDNNPKHTSRYIQAFCLQQHYNGAMHLSREKSYFSLLLAAHLFLSRNAHETV